MSEAQWYMAVGGQQVGPVNEQDVVNAIKSGSADGTTPSCSRPEWTNWTPLRQVDRFRSHLPATRAAADPGSVGPALRCRARNEIDFYEIVGEDLQFVDVELDPNESVVAEAGALMYMTQGIQMETIFGDGSGTQAKGADGRPARRGQAHPDRRESLHDGVHGPGRRASERVAFAAPYPGPRSWRWT